MQIRTVWQRIESMVGHQIYTLSQRKPFEIIQATPKGLTIRIGSSGKERFIERWKFESAAELKHKGERVSPQEVRSAGISVVHTTYVAAVVAAMPSKPDW